MLRTLILGAAAAAAIGLAAAAPAQAVRFEGPIVTIFVGARQMMAEIALNSPPSCEELVA